MSKFSRALAGAGAAVASIASKYIDEEMAMARAEALADLQRRTAGAIRDDDDAFRNDPTRIARDRETRRQDLLAAGAATRETEMAGLQDITLQGARAAQKDREAADDTRRAGERVQALTPYEVAAERARATARTEVETQALRERLPLEVQRAEAVARASAKYRDSSPTAKLAEIEGVLGRKLAEPEKLALLGLAKGGGATEQVETDFDQDGKPIGSKRTVKGPLGIGGADAPPDPAAQLRAGIERARADGKVTDAIAELEKRGASPAQILAAGVSEDEYRAAKQPSKQPGGPAEQPSLFQRARKAMADEGAVVENLRAKVRSGAALTEEERTMARAYGMGPV